MAGVMGVARIVVSAIFFVNVAVLASWLPHIPAVKARLQAGDAGRAEPGTSDAVSNGPQEEATWQPGW